MPNPAPDAAARRALAVRVWGSVCRHIDGMAIGSTMAALASHGALRILAAADRTEFGKLRAGLGAQPGFLHVAIRLLADQGWVTSAGEGGTDELTITPTPGGRVVMTRLASAYAEAARFLILAGRVGADPVAADAALGPFLEAVRGDWGLPVTAVPADVRHQVLAHLNGHLIAPVMFGLVQANRPPAGERGADPRPARLGTARRRRRPPHRRGGDGHGAGPPVPVPDGVPPAAAQRPRADLR
jgi:hypothetical protein